MEQEDGNDEPEGHDEPSLGSFDRIIDQSKSWRTSGSLWAYPPLDAEVDDCDREDCDPEECKLQPAVMA